VLPEDRARGFAAAAHQKINGALLRCEERYPTQGAHSVVYVVVDRDAASWKESLRSLHEEYFGKGQIDPLAPVRLEIVDRATDEALQRLIGAGLVAKTTRGTRSLWPDGTEGTIPALSLAEQQKVAEYRNRATRKLKMARVLADAGLTDEAQGALKEAVPALGGVLAIEQHLTEPASLQDCIAPVLAPYWKEALPAVRSIILGVPVSCDLVSATFTGLANPEAASVRENAGLP
jgi:hypothetical protein